MVEKTRVGVHQSDALLITGLDHDLVCGGARRRRNVLNTTLQRKEGKSVTVGVCGPLPCDLLIECFEYVHTHWRVFSEGGLCAIYPFGAVDVVSEGEEGVGADSHSLQGADPVPPVGLGQRLRDLLVHRLPHRQV